MQRELTDEEKIQLKEYQKSTWEGIALNTAALNRPEAIKTVNAHYDFVKRARVPVLFFDSPFQCQLAINLLEELSAKERQALLKDPQAQSRLNALVLKQNKQVKESYQYYYSHDWGQLEALWVAFYRFCETVGMEFTSKQCQVLDLWEASVRNCSLWYAFDEVAILCERPTAIHLDAQNRLHKDGAFALSYRDEWGVYAWHGVFLPEQYGSVRSELWKAAWIPKERNAQLRQILTEGIGYERVVRDLKATKVSQWKEYTLLKLKDVADIPIMLLSMTCPSTGHTHILPVPEDSKTAEAAITWVNWGIHPDEFGVQQ